jgi:PAS domain S-box-containing protein
MTNYPPSHTSADAIILRYEALLSQTSDFITIMDLNGHYIAASQSVRNAFGLNEDKLSQYTYLDRVPESERESAKAMYARILAGEKIPTYERIFLKHDGTTFIGEVNVMLIRDHNGNPYEIMSIIRDITERKQIEAKLLERQVMEVQLQKEQEVNRLRADLLVKVNHEFRTPLAVINTYVSLIERHFERLTPERRQEYLGNVRQNIHRVTDMLDDLYVIYQSQSGAHKQKEPFELTKVIEDVVVQLRSTLGREHHIHFDVSGTIPLFNGYERLIWHMAYNVMVNAVHYSDKGSRVDVQLHFVDDVLSLRVADRGVGIAQADIMRVTEPFFRGENVSHYEGTGLGLSVVNEAVLAHDGLLDIDSTVGAGTTITIHLPFDKS